MTRIALLGVGRWGKKLLRNLGDLDRARPDLSLVAAADPDVSARDHVKAAGWDARSSLEELLRLPALDAIVIATPPGLHHAHARQALEAGKHVLVEKPLAMTGADARELVGLAEASSLTLMVGHIRLFAESIRWVKRYVDEGHAGTIRHAFFQRINTGRVRQTVDAMWNLAPHDLAIADYWFGEVPDTVHAVGRSVDSTGKDDAALIRLRYPSGGAACIVVSWLTGTGARRASIVTDDCVIECDELADEPVVVHRGDSRFVPEIDQCEPLRAELEHFVECVAGRTEPVASGRGGAVVVSTLEAADRSKRERAAVTRLPAPMLI